MTATPQYQGLEGKESLPRSAARRMAREALLRTSLRAVVLVEMVIG